MALRAAAEVDDSDPESLDPKPLVFPLRLGLIMSNSSLVAAPVALGFSPTKRKCEIARW